MLFLAKSNKLTSSPEDSFPSEFNLGLLVVVLFVNVVLVLSVLNYKRKIISLDISINPMLVYVNLPEDACKQADARASK